MTRLGAGGRFQVTVAVLAVRAGRLSAGEGDIEHYVSENTDEESQER
ncbi:hypothetical protein [Streptomyces sp. NPDC046821]